MRCTLSILAIVIVLGATAQLLNYGCASNPNKIRAGYAPSLECKDYDCDQIAQEMDYISRRTTELYHSLKKDSSGDQLQMAAGALLFWPTLLAQEGGNGPEAAEYAQPKREYEALRQAALTTNCSIETLPPTPEEVVKTQDKLDSARFAFRDQISS